MKKRFNIFLIILMMVVCLFTIVGCSGNKTNKIASISYKNLDGDIVTLYSHYVFKIDKIIMCTQGGEHLKDVTNETPIRKCITKNKDNTYSFISTEEVPKGVDNIVKKNGLYGGTYLYSSEFECVVKFRIFILELEENYDLSIKNKHGMSTITYTSFSGSGGVYAPYYDESNKKIKTITVPQNNVTINYN